MEFHLGMGLSTTCEMETSWRRSTNGPWKTALPWLVQECALVHQTLRKSSLGCLNNIPWEGTPGSRKVGGFCCLVAKSCLTLETPWTVCSLPSPSVHRISQARILEWVAIFSSRGSSWPRDRTCVSCIAGRFFTTEPPGKPKIGSWVRTENWATGLKAKMSQDPIFLKLSAVVGWCHQAYSHGLRRLPVRRVCTCNIDVQLTLIWEWLTDAMFGMWRRGRAKK